MMEHIELRTKRVNVRLPHNIKLIVQSISPKFAKSPQIFHTAFPYWAVASRYENYPTMALRIILHSIGRRVEK